MRVATYNVQHARTPAGRVDVPLLGRTCDALGVDVLGMQEVDVDVARSKRTDQPKLVASAFAGGAEFVFGPALAFRRRGHYGNALVARFPIDDVEVVALPRRVGEPRVLLVATIAGTTVGVVHLDGTADERPPQLQRVIRVFEERPWPQVLLGDFNAPPSRLDPLRQIGFTVAGGPPSFPADEPKWRIDHIAVRGFTIETIDVPPVPVSDHRPVVAELTPQ